MSESEFDQFAETYDSDLHKALATSGEDKNYFAEARIAWTVSRLAQWNKNPRTVLDYGCGTGSATPFFKSLGFERQVGVDVSEKSIQTARKAFPNHSAEFLTIATYNPSSEFDLAFTNGVFHHIPPAERLSALRYILAALKPGGYFAFWENNPWNPGTRYIMSNCAFDHDAITLSPIASRRLLRTAGFEIVSCDFLFIFPRRLKWLRFLEPFLAKLPLGGQYLVIVRKP